MELTRTQALALLQKYNKEPFHIQHGLTVEGVMRWFAQENGEDVGLSAACSTMWTSKCTRRNTARKPRNCWLR